MRFPNESDGHATLFNLGRYAGARVRADPAARPLAELIRAPQGKLKDSVVARNQAEDALTDAEAERDFELDGFAEQVLDLGRHAHAHFRSRQHEGYVRLFPERPSAIAATPERDREKRLAGFVARVASKSTPAELAPQGKRVEAAWKRVQSAEATVAAARAALLAARSEEGKVRLDWLAAYRRLHAQLTDRYPNDKPRVERYFRSPAAPKAKRQPEVVAVA